MTWEKDGRGIWRSRCADNTWRVSKQDDGSVSYEGAQLAVLQDIRDELKKLNQLLHCQNAIDIPSILRQIRKNTTRQPRRRRK